MESLNEEFHSYLYLEMKSSYKFINNVEPTDEELNDIMEAANRSVIEKALVANKQLIETLNEYLKVTKEKYSKIIIHESAT